MYLCILQQFSLSFSLAVYLHLHRPNGEFRANRSNCKSVSGVKITRQSIDFERFLLLLLLWDYLWPCRQMNGPKFAFRWCLRCAHQFIGRSTQEVATRLISQCPASGCIFGYADLKATARITFVRFA